MLRGMRIARLTREKPVTLVELSRVIGVSASVMGRIEKETIGFQYRDAQVIASYLSVPLGELG